MTTHPARRAAGAAPGLAALPSEAPPGSLEGNPAPPQLHASMRGGAGPKLSPGMAKLAAPMTEADLERNVRAICRDLGLLLFHAFDSRKSEPGFPDLVIVGRGVLYRELKRESGRLTVAQKTWLAALVDAGQDACVWRPSDLLAGRVARKLAALAGIGAP